MATKQQTLVDKDYQYGFRDQTDTYSFKARKGIDHDIVEQISQMKHEPQWMRDFRHRSLDIFLSKPLPLWADLEVLGPDRFRQTSTTTCERPTSKARRGKKYPLISSARSIVWASPKRSASFSAASPPNTILKSSTTASAKTRSARRAVLRHGYQPCASTKTSCASTSPRLSRLPTTSFLR